jgi:hypothetical protein
VISILSSLVTKVYCCNVALQYWVYGIPLTLGGSYLGKALSKCTFIDEDHRNTDNLPKFLNPLNSFLLSGIPSFLFFYFQISLILASSWPAQHHSYMLLFLACATVTIIVTSVEVTLLWIYLGLYYQDHRWQWKAFGTSISTSLYLSVFAAYHFLTRSYRIEYFAAISFSLFIIILCLGYAFVCGTINYFCASKFVTYLKQWNKLI